MDWKPVIKSFDGTIDAAMVWLAQHGNSVFTLLRHLLEGGYESVLWLLHLVPWCGMAALLALLSARTVGLGFGLLTALGLALCWAMGLWAETLETLALVLSSTLMAVIFGGALGILAGYRPKVARALEPVLDLIQTLPPYLYLLPAIAFLGYGPATAILATCIVAVPPTVKLTALGISRTPVEFMELGAASGASDWQVFAKIRLPFALPSIMAGVNQSLMLAFGMVVIAGIVGSGGLGETIYAAVRTLDIATSIDAALAIVVLTILLDRVSQSAARKETP